VIFLSTVQLIADDVYEVTHRKLLKMKNDIGLGDISWSEFFDKITEDIFLLDDVNAIIQKATRDNLLKVWCVNFGDNLEDIRNGKTIRDLVPLEAQENENVVLGPGVVVGRGPSIYKHKHLNLLAKSNFKGAIVASDGSLIDCLKRGVIPTHVVSVDGNNELIWKWYDDPLVDKYGSKIKAILCVSVAHNVVERCKKAGIEIFWFNPQFDDYRRNDSFTKLQMLMTRSEKNPGGAPNVTCGGNAGCTSWVLSTGLLRRSPVGLIGIDLGYLEETPLEETAYYKQVMDSTNGNINIIAADIKMVNNPFFKVKAKADTIFRQYRSAWLDILKQMRPNIRTINCTEGGTLFTLDPKISLEYSKFSTFLQENS